MINSVNKPSKWIGWNIYRQHSISVGKLISEVVIVRELMWFPNLDNVRMEEFIHGNFFFIICIILG